MSIARELSCDVAAAMLAERGDGANPPGSDLTDIILEVHSTLRRLTNESRHSRLNKQFFPTHAEATPGSSAASGSH